MSQQLQDRLPWFTSLLGWVVFTVAISLSFQSSSFIWPAFNFVWSFCLYANLVTNHIPIRCTSMLTRKTKMANMWAEDHLKLGYNERADAQKIYLSYLPNWHLYNIWSEVEDIYKSETTAEHIVYVNLLQSWCATEYLVYWLEQWSSIGGPGPAIHRQLGHSLLRAQFFTFTLIFGAVCIFTFCHL